MTFDAMPDHDALEPPTAASADDLHSIDALIAEVTRLRAEVDALRSERAVAALHEADDDDTAPLRATRRQMMRVAGASAIGLVVGSQTSVERVAADDPNDVVKNTTNSVVATTVLDGSVAGPVLTAYNRSDATQANAVFGQSFGNAPAIRGDNEETDGLGGIAIGGNAPGGRDLYAFGSGRIAMDDHAFGSVEQYSQGEIHQNGGVLYAMVTPTVRREIVGPLAAGALHAVGPTRVYDSRRPIPDPGRLGPGESRVVSVATGRSVDTGAPTVSNLVPPGATAIMYNITVTGTIGPGFLNVSPADVTSVDASIINWTESGTTIANASMVGLSGDRLIRVTCAASASTDFIIDVIGYYS